MKPPEQLWLEDYGLIGDLRSSALIGADGSVSWLCLPRLDSPSVFGALLDEAAGSWRIQPAETKTLGKQNYWPQSNALDTVFELPSSQVTLTDFMPLGSEALHSGLKAVRLIRRVRVTGAACEVVADFAPRPNYGKAAKLSSTDGLLSVQQGKQTWYLWSSQAHTLSKDKRGAQAHFTLEPDQEVWFALSEQPIKLEPEVLSEFLDDTHRTWANWLAAGQARRTLGEHPHRDIEQRSALVLKLLSAPDGGIAAAATTSLPEVIGGERNWDYRYCWLRDSTFTGQALHHLGHREEAAELLKWFRKAAGRSTPKNLKIAYTVAGEAVPAERSLKLSGYKHSRPVHVGNGARNQKQLDVYGEVMAAYFDALRNRQMALDDDIWKEISGLAGAVCQLWKRPDKGIWEAWQAGQHHTYSKLMCWVALDRAVKLGEQGRRKVLSKWKKERDAVRGAILDRGFNADLNSFTQTFGGTTLDATSLITVLMGFLPPDDKRVLGTIKAVQDHLADSALVRRYSADDGMAGQEGYFILCSFWLISAEALCGQVEQSKQHLSEMLSHCSPLGLLAEEITPDGQHLLGNFPQAYSHVGLVNALAHLQKAEGKLEDDTIREISKASRTSESV